jgi:hypothetical protein
VSDELLRRDVHPAEIAMPDGTVLAGCRVFVTTHRLIAWQVVERKPTRVLDVELAEPGSVPGSRATLPANGRLECRLIDSGTTWVNKGRGCGCGSPLKALGPPVPWTRREAA